MHSPTYETPVEACRPQMTKESITLIRLSVKTADGAEASTEPSGSDRVKSPIFSLAQSPGGYRLMRFCSSGVLSPPSQTDPSFLALISRRVHSCVIIDR
jgi:hypothetical protein